MSPGYKHACMVLCRHSYVASAMLTLHIVLDACEVVAKRLPGLAAPVLWLCWAIIACTCTPRCWLAVIWVGLIAMQAHSRFNTNIQQS